MYEWHGFGGMTMWILWILIVVALIWLASSATRRGRDSGKRDKTALEILEERYARGEIDRDEFLQKRDDLQP
jgi:putative membrane protein